MIHYRTLTLGKKQQKIDIIDNGSMDDFIHFAKNYNIFQPEPHSKIYEEVCDKIKARLDREGLSHETVRPE
jgi:hypothetical protein